MEKGLRILFLEDVPADAQLEEYELKKAGLVFTSRLASTKEAFLKELDDFLPDLILSDYKLPSFNGLEALLIVQEKYPDLPFILVTGEAGEEFAIETLKSGATDYVLKENLKRLVPALQRALQETEVRRERKRAEEALRESETQLRMLSDNLPNGLVYQINSGEDGQQRRFSYISAGIEQLHGITVAEALNDAMSVYGQVFEEDRDLVAEREALALASMRPFSIEARIQLPTGEIRWRLFTSAPRRLPNHHLVWDGIEIDITERKNVEENLKERVKDLETFYHMAVNRELRMNELKKQIEKLKEEITKYKNN